MKWIDAKQEKPNPDDYLMVLLSDYENTYYYTDLKGWDEIEDSEDEYGIAWSELPKHPDQDSTGWNVITDTPFNELDFEDEVLVYFKHEDGGYMDIYCPHNACEIEPQYFGEITHWMKIPAIPSYATPTQEHHWKMASKDNGSIESQSEITTLTNQIDELSAQVEQLECQLAGCGVAALQNTRDSAAQRATPGEYGYSGSYEEVCRAVDREMVLREQRDELLTELKATESRLHEVSTLCATVEQQRDEMRTVLDKFNLSAKTYTFSDTDMKTIHQALTLVSRLKQGLWYEALFWLPYIEDVDWNLLRNEIQPIMSKYFKENTKPIDGWNTYLNQNPQMEYLLEKTEKLIGESSRIEVCTSNLVYETKDL